jgi:hypothetical protein
MTTEERKAWDLIDKYFPLVEFDLDRNKQIQNAKKIALITVEEILVNIDATILYHKDSKALPINKDYWLQVRKVLNAL